MATDIEQTFAAGMAQIVAAWPGVIIPAATWAVYEQHFVDLDPVVLKLAIDRVCRQHDGYFPTIACIRDEAAEVNRERERERQTAAELLPPPRQTVSPERYRQYIEAIRGELRARPVQTEAEAMRQWRRDLVTILGPEANPGPDCDMAPEASPEVKELLRKHGLD